MQYHEPVTTADLIGDDGSFIVRRRNGITYKLTLESLRRAVVYDPESGAFYWKGNRTGYPASYPDTSGEQRNVVYLDAIEYAAARLAWFYVKGTPPTPHQTMRHVDDDPFNDAFKNLGIARRGEAVSRALNKTSGVRGVCWAKRIKRWRVSIFVDGKNIELGHRKALAEAKSLRRAGERHYWGGEI